MPRSSSNVLLNSGTASQMVKKFIAHDYGTDTLAELLRTDEATVEAIACGNTRHSKRLCRIHDRLIHLYCKTKWRTH